MKKRNWCVHGINHPARLQFRETDVGNPKQYANETELGNPSFDSCFIYYFWISITHTHNLIRQELWGFVRVRQSYENKNRKINHALFKASHTHPPCKLHFIIPGCHQIIYRIYIIYFTPRKAILQLANFVDILLITYKYYLIISLISHT